MKKKIEMVMVMAMVVVGEGERDKEKTKIVMMKLICLFNFIFLGMKTETCVRKRLQRVIWCPHNSLIADSGGYICLLIREKIDYRN